MYLLYWMATRVSSPTSAPGPRRLTGISPDLTPCLAPFGVQQILAEALKTERAHRRGPLSLLRATSQAAVSRRLSKWQLRGSGCTLLNTSLSWHQQVFSCGPLSFQSLILSSLLVKCFCSLGLLTEIRHAENTHFHIHFLNNGRPAGVSDGEGPRANSCSAPTLYYDKLRGREQHPILQTPLLQAWPEDQQQQQSHMGVCQKRTIAGLTPDLGKQNLHF